MGEEGDEASSPPEPRPRPCRVSLGDVYHDQLDGARSEYKEAVRSIPFILGLSFNWWSRTRMLVGIPRRSSDGVL
jgi:hypothetical protein